MPVDQSIHPITARFVRVVRTFFEGLTRPSATSLVGILIVFLTLTIIAVSIITPRTLARINPGYLMRDPWDSYALITTDVFRLNRQGYEPDSVLLIGTSALDHAIVSAQDIEDRISARIGRRVRVYPIIAPALSLWDVGTVVENIRSPFNGLVVMSTSVFALAAGDHALFVSHDTARLALSSQFMSAEMKRAGFTPRRRIGNYFFDNARFYSARLTCIKNVLTGPHRPGKLYDDKPLLPDQGRWDRMIDKLNSILDEYPAHAPSRELTLLQVLDLTRALGNVEFAFVESVMNPLAVPLLRADSLSLYEQRMAEFTAEHDIAWWNLVDETAPDPADFIDWTHMRPSPTRERHSEALAARIAAAITKRTAHAEHKQ